MKNLFFATAVLVTSTLFSQADGTLSFGWQWGFHGNKSEFSGGMEQASGHFRRNDFGGVGVCFQARYDLNKYVYFTGGLGVYTWGFNFSLREDYSLRLNEEKMPNVVTKLHAIEFPFMAYAKSRSDCRNRRWVAGLGVSAGIGSRYDISKFVDPNNEGNSSTKYLSSEVKTPGGGTAFLRLALGREKVMQCGNILHAEFLFNFGFRNLATATVNYTMDGREYQHEFSNSGRFAGIRLVFYCGKCSSRPGRKD